MIFIVKKFPSNKKIRGEEKIVFAASTESETYYGEVVDFVLNMIVKHKEEAGLLVAPEHAKQVVSKSGIGLLGLNEQMDFCSIEVLNDREWDGEGLY